VKLYADGVPITKIMKETGASVSAVYRAVGRFRRAFKRPKGKRQLNELRLKAVLDALAAGELYRRIARRHGVTPQAISAIAKKFGMSRRGRK